MLNEKQTTTDEMSESALACRTIYILIISHPDDESMFFYPTISHHLTTSTQQEQNFYVLCLSNGNYDGMGKTREKELYKCLKDIYNIPPNKVEIIHTKKLQDHPRDRWEYEVVEAVVQNFIRCTLFRDYESSLEQTLRVIILTFDSGGVSGHRNHIDTCKGLEFFVMNIMNRDASSLSEDEKKQKQKGKEEPTILYSDNNGKSAIIELYQLDTIYTPLRKYIAPLELFFLLYPWLCGVFSSSFSPSGDNSKIPLFLSFRPLQVWRAMAIHHSQFVWYRKLSVLFSRYSYINTWTKFSP